MKIYLVRHGLSIGNKNHIHQFPDSSLSEEGQAQARAIAERVKNLPINFIYSSNIARAQETAKLIAEKSKHKIETWEELREIKRPSQILGKRGDSAEAKKFEEAMKDNYKNPYFKYSDEDSFSELKERAEKVLNHLVEKHTGENVLLVSHGTFIKMLVSFVVFGKNLTPEIFWDLREHTYAENTGISIVEHTPERGWRLLTFNDISHL
jgi:uncharacterized phosphatase